MKEGRVIHLAVGTFALLLLLAIVLAVRLSTLRPPSGSWLYGSDIVWRGHRAAFRVVALEADGTDPLPMQKVSLSLRDGRGRQATHDASGHWVAEGSLAVPANLDSDPWLDVEV